MLMGELMTCLAALGDVSGGWFNRRQAAGLMKEHTREVTEHLTPREGSGDYTVY